MKSSNYSNHSEYVFNLDELRKLINNAPREDTLFCITVGFNCNDAPGSRSYHAKIEGATGTKIGMSSAHIEGCPRPPGCSDLIVSLGL